MHYQHNSLQFVVQTYGVKSRQAVVLLHGFPAGTASWRPTATRLAAAGYYVLMPELRGDSLTARPHGRRNYSVNKIASDIVALLESRNIPKAHIVGHDWGGAVAWAFAAAHPDKTLSLAAIAAPHPKAMMRAVWQSKQLFAARHMSFFQLAWLPEWVIRRHHGRDFKKMLMHSGLDAKNAALYAQRMQNRALLTSMLNWYRALPFTLLQLKKMPTITTPTLFMYGKKDVFLTPKAAVSTKQFVLAPYVYTVWPEATHWIPEQHAQQLASELCAFYENAHK